MNQISKIEQLYAKSKIYKIPKEIKGSDEVQIELEITPLSLDDMGVLNLNKDMPLSELSKNAKKMFSISLGLTEEEVSKISIRYMKDIMEAIMEANDFTEEDMKSTGMKDFIEQKQKQISEKNG